VFVAAADSGTDRVVYSRDGITWQPTGIEVTHTTVNMKWYSYGGCFIASGNMIYASYDGLNWFRCSGFGNLGSSDWRANVIFPTGRLCGLTLSGRPNGCYYTTG